MHLIINSNYRYVTCIYIHTYVLACVNYHIIAQYPITCIPLILILRDVRTYVRTSAVVISHSQMHTTVVTANQLYLYFKIDYTYLPFIIVGLATKIRTYAHAHSIFNSCYYL